MKNIFVVFLAFIGLPCLAQIKHPQIILDSSNLYYRSLVIHLDYVKPMSFTEGPYNINIQEFSYVTENLPLKIGEFNLHYLNTDDIMEQTKNKCEIPILRVLPMNVSNDTVEIGIIDFDVSRYKKKNLGFAKASSGTFCFRFDCERNHFELVHFHQGGFEEIHLLYK